MIIECRIAIGRGGDAERGREVDGGIAGAAERQNRLKSRAAN